MYNYRLCKQPGTILLSGIRGEKMRTSTGDRKGSPLLASLVKGRARSASAKSPRMTDYSIAATPLHKCPSASLGARCVSRSFRPAGGRTATKISPITERSRGDRLLRLCSGVSSSKKKTEEFASRTCSFVFCPSIRSLYNPVGI